MSFILYDLAFLVIFTLLVILFLYRRRRNLQRQGILYLYKTKLGIRFINWTSKKLSFLLKPLQYLVVASGYALMAFIIWFLVKFSYLYLSSPLIAKAIKVPVLLPLVPYLPTLFKIDFLPPFYFTYWILIIALIAIPHEFAHGIFSKLNKIKIHSTGFGFLGPFLAAFVEPDEKKMEKTSKFSQLSVLSAGTFANILVAVVLGLVLWGFFASAFTPVGVQFNTYAISPVNISDIDEISNITLQDSGFIQIKSQGKTYHTGPTSIQQSMESNLPYIVAYEDSPAFNAKLAGAITEIEGKPTLSQEDLVSALQAHAPGETINIRTLQDDQVVDYNITLEERNGRAFLGIGITPVPTKGMMGYVYGFISKIKDPAVHYKSSIGGAGIFIFDLLWWAVLISLSVALINMVPVGIFDGEK
jgi:membrane-associated protease RseP (regulator of RpoE activity)